jgi:hypothetical protein
MRKSRRSCPRKSRRRCRRISRSYRRRLSRKRSGSGSGSGSGSNIQEWIAFKKYMHNGMTNKSFIMLPREKKIAIVKEALRVVKHPRAKKNTKADLKYLEDLKRSRRSKRSKRRSFRRFGYSHDQGPQIYNAHMQDGILLADNAFQWMGNPLERSENAGSG